MKLQIPFLCAAGLSLAILAVPSHARSIRVDATMTCSTVVPSTGTLSVELTGTAKKGNRAKSGVNFPVLACFDSIGNDASLTSLTYDPSNSVLYTWVDLSSASNLTASSLTGSATNPATPELSSFGDSNVIIAAMVNVLKLTGSYTGDYEIQFNYEDSPEIACNNVFKPIAPSFTWFGHKYVFTNTAAIGNPCVATNTNDFLFGPGGTLLGYNSAPDGSGFSLTEGLPPGWIEK
jgi:hypothetical protein